MPRRIRGICHSSKWLMGPRRLIPPPTRVRSTQFYRLILWSTSTSIFRGLYVVFCISRKWAFATIENLLFYKILAEKKLQQRQFFSKASNNEYSNEWMNRMNLQNEWIILISRNSAVLFFEHHSCQDPTMNNTYNKFRSCITEYHECTKHNIMMF